MRSSRIQTASYTSQHVVVGKFKRGSKGRLVLERLLTLPLTNRMSAQGKEGTTSVPGVLSSHPDFRGPVDIAINGQVALTKTTRTPAIAKTRRRKIAEFEASQIIPYALADVVRDFSVLGQDGAELELTIVAAKKDIVEQLCDSAESANFRVERLAPSSTALRDAFRFNYPDISEPVLLISIGGKSTDVLLIDENRSYYRTITLDGEVPADAARTAHLRGISAVETEGAEDRDADVATPNIHQTSTLFVTRLAAEVAKAMAAVRQQTSLSPAAVYVTGGDSVFESLNEILTERLSIPVEQFDPVRRVDVSDNVAFLQTGRANGAVGELVGLAAARLLGQGTGGVNLLPPELLVGRKFRESQPWWIAAAALLAISVVPPIQHFRNITQRANREANRIEAIVTPMRVLKQTNIETMAELERSHAETSTLAQLIDEKGSWSEFLAEVQSRVGEVDGVWIERLAVLPVATVERENDAQLSSNSSTRITLGGCLLHRKRPSAKEATASFAKVKQVLTALRKSPWVAAIDGETFDDSHAGILRFEFILTASRSVRL
jgi:type IV pilus assembly protein PilM